MRKKAWKQGGFVRLLFAFTFILISLHVYSCREDKCSYLNYFFELPNDIDEQFVYAKVYASDENFSSGEGGFEKDHLDTLIGSPEDFRAGLSKLDLRTEEGMNSWSNQQDVFYRTNTAFDYDACRASVLYPPATVLRELTTSSPTYLHLVLDSLMEDGGDKSWVIDRIYDNNQQDITMIPSWQCLRNLVFTFYKGGKGARIKLTYQGEETCSDLAELFDGRNEAYATYSLEGVAQDRLEITYPTIHENMRLQFTFAIRSSTYEEIQISVTDGDQQLGYTSLIPLHDDD